MHFALTLRLIRVDVLYGSPVIDEWKSLFVFGLNSSLKFHHRVNDLPRGLAW